MQAVLRRVGTYFGVDFEYFSKSGFWVIFRQGVGAGAGLALYMTFSRLAPKEVFGQYQLVLSVFAALSFLSLPGLNTALSRAVARGFDGDYLPIVKTSFLCGLLGIPVMLLVGKYYSLQDPALGLIVAVAGLFFPFIYAFSIWESFLQGKGKFRAIAWYASLYAIAGSTVVITLLLFGVNNSLSLVAAYLFIQAVLQTIFFLRSRKGIANDKQEDGTLRYGWFLSKVSFLGLIAEQADKLLVGVLLGPVSLAAYAMISLIPIRLKDFLKTLNAVAFPKLSNSEEDFFSLIKTHKKSLLFVHFGVLAIALLYLVGIPALIEMLFTKEYSEYASLSRWFSVTVFLALPVSFMSTFINARKNTRAIILTNPVFFLLKIILTGVLTYRYGLFGTVIAFNFSLVLSLVLNMIGISLYREGAKS